MLCSGSAPQIVLSISSSEVAMRSVLIVLILMALQVASYGFLVRGHGSLGGKVNLGLGQSYLARRAPWLLVWAGSSITQRLPAHHPESGEFNFGMGGQSALTALEIIHSSRPYPRAVVVEVSFTIGEPIDDGVMRNLLGRERWLWVWFPVLREEFKIMNQVEAGLNSYMRWRSSRTPCGGGISVPSGSDMGNKLSQDVDRAFLDMYKKRYESTDWCKESVFFQRCLRFRQLMSDLRSSGVHILLYRPVLHPDLASGDRVRAYQTRLERLLMSGGFGPSKSLDHLGLKTVDGLHLTVDSARIAYLYLRQDFVR